MTHNIYVWFEKEKGRKPNDIVIYAIAEDGDLLVRHVSGGEKFYAHDAGFTSEFSHHKYKLKYKDGNFYLNDVRDPSSLRWKFDKKFQAAWAVFERKYRS